MHYAGIGTRYPVATAVPLLLKIAAFLAKRHAVLHSGAADGVDQILSNAALASGGFAVLHVPWKTHADQYLDTIPADQRRRVTVQVLESRHGRRDHQAFASVERYHPESAALSWGARCLHARNYRIVVPQPQHRVDFVAALPAIVNGEAVGGTMQGIRIAEDLRIPVVRLDLLSEQEVKRELLWLIS
jgi:hypothetical protein